MTAAEIDWGDYPDWRARLEAARRPPTADQAAFDTEWDGLWTQARTAGRDHKAAIRSDSDVIHRVLFPPPSSVPARIVGVSS